MGPIASANASEEVLGLRLNRAKGRQTVPKITIKSNRKREIKFVIKSQQV